MGCTLSPLLPILIKWLIPCPSISRNPTSTRQTTQQTMLTVFALSSPLGCFQMKKQTICHDPSSLSSLVRVTQINSIFTVDFLNQRYFTLRYLEIKPRSVYHIVCKQRSNWNKPTFRFLINEQTRLHWNNITIKTYINLPPSFFPTFSSSTPCLSWHLSNFLLGQIMSILKTQGNKGDLK